MYQLNQLYNWCRVYCSEFARDNYMVLVGTEENIEVCKYIHSVVFNVAVTVGKKEYAKYKKDFEKGNLPFSKPVSRGAYLRTFIDNFAKGLDDKFKAEQDEFKRMNTNASAIILANDGLIVNFVENQLGPIKTTTQKGGVGNFSNARDKGYETGRNVEITKGVETSSKPIDVKFLK